MASLFEVIGRCSQPSPEISSTAFAKLGNRPALVEQHQAVVDFQGRRVNKLAREVGAHQTRLGETLAALDELQLALQYAHAGTLRINEKAGVSVANNAPAPLELIRKALGLHFQAGQQQGRNRQYGTEPKILVHGVALLRIRDWVTAG
jgi:hypothetical protein